MKDDGNGFITHHCPANIMAYNFGLICSFIGVIKSDPMIINHICIMSYYEYSLKAIVIVYEHLMPSLKLDIILSHSHF